MNLQLIDFFLRTYLYFMNLYNYHLTKVLQNNERTVSFPPTRLYFGYYSLNSQHLALCQAKSRYLGNANQLSEFFQYADQKQKGDRTPAKTEGLSWT